MQIVTVELTASQAESWFTLAHVREAIISSFLSPSVTEECVFAHEKINCKIWMSGIPSEMAVILWWSHLNSGKA